MKTDIQTRLDEDIPKDAINTRSQGGTTLSYLSGAYVINRLNQVLGQGNWAYTSEVNKLHEGTVEQRSGTAYYTSYSARVRLVVTIDGQPTEFTDYGFGDGTDKSNPGKAHELAIKESITDGLKRAAKNLGISMGLGLYFKDGDYEVDTNDTSRTSSGDTNPTGAIKLGGVSNGQSSVGRKTNGSSGKSVTPATVDKRTVLREITRLLISQRKTTAEDFVKKYLSGKTSQELTEEDIASALVNVNNDYKELNLLKE